MQKSTELLEIIDELQNNAEQIDGRELQNAAKEIAASPRIFVAGVGRTGCAMRAFSNRLMHLGRSVHFVGEPTTPVIRPGDLLIVGSGSGETGSLVIMTQKAKKIGAKILAITIHSNSSIGSLADHCILLPGATPKSALKDTCKTVQPMGSAFEQMAWLVGDALVLELMQMLKISADDMFSNHANLE
jgi:6-phospho-3-hexuloisomerase